jgi:hypothetical protein
MNEINVPCCSLMEEWDVLLKEFMGLACAPSVAGQISFYTLLTEFAAAEKQADGRQAAQSIQDKTDFGRLLGGYDKEFRRWRKEQITSAEDFNLVDLLDLVRDENRHSNVLAWLLNGDVYHATHSQGDLGFRIFLKELGLPVNYADGDYRVGREIQGTESRIDIEIREPGRFIIHIEVKIGAGQGKAQLEREWRDLERKADSYNIADERHIHAFYLTPGGEDPSGDQRFKPISWEQMADVFDEFGKYAKAESVRWFALHYAHALRKFIVQHHEEENSDA